MVKPDTIKLLTDSMNMLPDSLSSLDSIAAVDSISRADSLRLAIKIPSGFTGISHPSLPQTETWVFLCLLALFFLFVYSIAQSFGLISDTIKSFFQVKERSSIFSKATVNDSRFRFFLIIFSIGVLSFYAFLIMHKTSSPFSIKQYGLFLIATTLFFGLKSLVLDLLGYVFLNPTITSMAKEAYFNIMSFWGVALAPILILEVYLVNNYLGITHFLSLIISISVLILIIIKLFQIFFRKILASFYIILYLCTLEFLPYIILYKVFKLIV